MKNPLVSIAIPTYNSEKFINRCLQAIKSQSYDNIEIIIVDGGSTDNTLTIASNYTRSIYKYEKALLGARDLGVKKSKGKYVLLLDSDQILNKNTIGMAVKKIELQELDMLVFEEDVYSNKRIIEKLFHLDRKLIHKIKDLSPYTGVMLPRFYKRKILINAVNKIPEKVKANVGGQDHAIIYLESWNLSKKVDILSKAVKHIEPNTLKEIWRKFYRWGYTSISARNGKYNRFFKKKEKFRKGLFRRGMFKESIASVILLMLKGVPYKIGVLHAKLLAKFYTK